MDHLITRDELDSIRDVWRRRAQRAQQDAIQAQVALSDTRKDLAAMTEYAREVEDVLARIELVETIRLLCAEHLRAASILDQDSP